MVQRLALLSFNDTVRLRSYYSLASGKLWNTLRKHAWPTSNIFHAEDVIRQGSKENTVKIVSGA